jgi:cytoskeletal protein CcmA (bactofilin family)
MAIFGGSEKKEVKKSVHSTTIITGCMNINGNIEGCGMIHIDGTVHGDLDVDETVIIGASGSVYGNIKSKKVIVSGKLEGSVSCDSLEVTQTGVVSDKIIAKEIIADGTVDATLIADDIIRITENGNVTTEHLQSKHVIVNGHIDGNVTASELLEINKDGEVKGKMIVKKIKVTEGGLMLGTMLTYNASDDNSISKTESKVETENESADESADDEVL